MKKINLLMMTIMVALIVTTIYMKDTYKSAFMYIGVYTGDGLSNLEPIIQYKHSILDEHSFPLYTELWFGGWNQWKNPLSSILYLPATLLYLLFPLNTATKIIFFIHIVVSIVAGWWIAKQFINEWVIQFLIGILFTSPMVAMIFAGHFEKIFSWPWVLIGLGILFSDDKNMIRKGILAGVCLGVIPLTGSNYYTFYAIILFLLIVSSYQSKKLWASFLLGSCIGLLHLPFISGLIGINNRGMARSSILNYKVDFPTLFKSLFWGNRQLVVVNDWEAYSLIGLPFAVLLLFAVYQIAAHIWNRQETENLNQILAIIISGIIFVSIATGLIYKGHHLLDTFRVPSRVTPFIGLVIILLVLITYKNLSVQTGLEPYIRKGIQILIILSALQVIWFSWLLRPTGSDIWINNKGIIDLTTYLNDQHATAVWLNFNHSTDSIIPVALMNTGIGVINTYYGDMGQRIKISGNHCGYSFDYLLTVATDPIEDYVLIPVRWGRGPGSQPVDAGKLKYLKSFLLFDKQWQVYAVQCNP